MRAALLAPVVCVAVGLAPAPSLAKRPRKAAAARPGRLVVTSEPAGALVEAQSDGAEVQGETPFSRELPAGSYIVAVSAPGHRPVLQTVVVEPKQDTTVHVRLQAKPPAAPPSPPPGPPPPSTPTPAPTEAPSEPGGPLLDVSWPGLAALAGGALLLAGGGVFGALSRSAEDDRDALKAESLAREVPYAEVRARDESARDRALLANVLLAGGVLAAAAGGVLLFTDLGEELGLAHVDGGAVLVLRGELP